MKRNTNSDNGVNGMSPLMIQEARAPVKETKDLQRAMELNTRLQLVVMSLPIQKKHMHKMEENCQ